MVNGAFPNSVAAGLCNRAEDRRRYGIALSCFILLLYPIGLNAPALADPPADEPAAASNAKKPDWELLETRFNGGERLTHVRVTMEPVEFTGFLDYLNRNQRVEVVTTDRLALNAIQQLLPGALRHATPRRDAVANATTLGEILVTTNRRSFVIGITDAGFALESRVATDENTFLSCGLAAVCDWILTNAEKAGISQEVRMHHLSPEGTLEEQRFYWMQVQSRFGDKSADGTDSSTIGAPKAQEEKRFERDKSR